MADLPPNVAVFGSDALRLTLALHRLVRSLRHVVPPSAGLSPTHLVVLSVLLEHGPARIGRLARLVPCSQPTATALVSQLEQDGWVRKETDPDDGRAVRISITDTGRSRMVELACGEAELLGGRLDALSEPEQRVIRDAIPVLGTLAQHLDRAEPSSP